MEKRRKLGNTWYPDLVIGNSGVVGVCSNACPLFSTLRAIPLSKSAWDFAWNVAGAVAEDLVGNASERD